MILFGTAKEFICMIFIDTFHKLCGFFFIISLLINFLDSFIKDVLTAWNGIMSFVKTYNVSWAYLSALCLLHFTYIHEHFL